MFREPALPWQSFLFVCWETWGSQWWGYNSEHWTYVKDTPIMFYTSSVWGLDQNEKNDWGKIRDMGQINGSFSGTIPAKISYGSNSSCSKIAKTYISNESMRIYMDFLWFKWNLHELLIVDVDLWSHWGARCPIMSHPFLYRLCQAWGWRSTHHSFRPLPGDWDVAFYLVWFCACMCVLGLWANHSESIYEYIWSMCTVFGCE